MQKSPLVFEISWEAGNKVGGIYTVLKSKCNKTVAELGEENYYLIGPYNGSTYDAEIEAIEPSSTTVIGRAIEIMKSQKINVYYGRWLVDGYPRIISLDLSSAAHKLDEWKSDLWSKCLIGVPWHDEETNNAVVFGNLVGWLIGEIQVYDKNRRYVAHFHEWLSGVGLIVCRAMRQLELATIFTTHATLLGRYLCSSKSDLYNNLESLQVDREAGIRGIYHRYCIERAATYCSHVFTTVSDITALEASKILNRKADIITPNGLNVKRFQDNKNQQFFDSSFSEQIQLQKKIFDFLRGHFCGHFKFDFDKTLFFFISGRYEFTNKGADIFIEALARLNHRLNSESSPLTIVVFFIFPTNTHSVNAETLRGQTAIKQLEKTIKEIEKGVGQRLYEKALQVNQNSSFPKNEELLTNDDILKIRQIIKTCKNRPMPPICTHIMADDTDDPVLNNLRRCELFNKPEDCVKIIFHPEFLTISSPVLSIDYQDFIRCCHLGVFPSFYEPWGYTPAECTIMGIPSVTTNLSGYGCYMQKLIDPDPKQTGVYIVDRLNKSPEESVEQLCQYLYDFTKMSRRQRHSQRVHCQHLSEHLDWRKLNSFYKQARQLALQRQHNTLSDQENDHLKSFSVSNYAKMPTIGLDINGKPIISSRLKTSKNDPKTAPEIMADTGKWQTVNVNAGIKKNKTALP